MSGNISEWCNDWYHKDYYQIIENFISENKNLPQISDEKVIRGGSFRDIAFDVRITSRKPAKTILRDDKIGFRIVKIKKGE